MEVQFSRANFGVLSLEFDARVPIPYGKAGAQTTLNS